jgi:hypothetical protein
MQRKLIRNSLLIVVVLFVASLIVLNAHASSLPLFSPAVSYPAGGQSVAVADVNGDGKPDLLTAGGGVGVLLSNGDGTFQPVVNYGSGGSQPQSIAVADVNGDGAPDLLVANSWSDTVGVLLGNGDGTYQPAVTYGSGGTYPLPIAVADVNGDRKPDLLVANYLSYNVAVLLGDGNGRFDLVESYYSMGDPGSLSVADVNGDSKPDVVVAGYGVEVHLGNGDGTFRGNGWYSSGAFYAKGLVVADVNGDEKLDIVLANCAPKGSRSCEGIGSMAVLLGIGDGTFQPAKNRLSGADDARSVAVADVDDDGKPDVVIAHGCRDFSSSCPGVLGVLLGNGDGTFRSALTYGSGGNWAEYVAAADLNGDGKPDLVASNQSSTVGVLLNILHRPTKAAVSTSGTASFVGQLVTFTATVTSSYGAIPDGELVTFYDGTRAMASAALANRMAAFTTSSLSAKTHVIKATYAGDTNFFPSTGIVTQVVVKYPTTTVLISSSNPSTYGQPVTFIATVTSTGPTLTGKVWFKDGTTGIGTVTLNGRVATLTKPKLAVGTHPITAQYLGDGASAKSTSSILNQVVQ